MDWRIASALTLVLWGSYSIFGTKAGEVHGEKVNMAFETLAFIVLALVALAGYWDDFTKVTQRSALNASIMRLMSAGGFYLLLYALRVAPHQLPIIILITGAYPVVTVLAMYFLGSRFATHQWVGVALAAAGLLMVNWPKK